MCEPRVQQTLSEISSFSDEIQRHGKRPGGLLLVSELVRGSENVREQLRLTDTEQAIRLERLRSADAAVRRERDGYAATLRPLLHEKVPPLTEAELAEVRAGTGTMERLLADAEEILRGSRASERTTV